tara:strand:- start:30 stop:389 length:360 start_codon:yes stop_codon:yes gene_type:complete
MKNKKTHNTQITGIIEENITDSRERDIHPNSLKNLKKFEKGQSGNPLGSGIKYQKLAKVLKSKADYVTPKPLTWEEKIVKAEEQDPRTNRDKVIDRIWYEAKTGNIKYVELLARLGCLD